MSSAAISVTVGGAAVAVAQTWPVTTPSARSYRAVFYLRLSPQAPADGITIDPAGCQLEAAFQPFDYNALNTPPLPAASLSLSRDNKAVLVQLDGARQILSIALSPARPVELHRADGSVQADKAADSAGFTDAHFGIQPVDASPISVAQVKQIMVRGVPGNPRIGIAAVDLQHPAIFWPPPDLAGQTQVSASAAFAKALQTHVASQQSPLPAHIDVALVILSDAPCVISIVHLTAAYHLLRKSFSPALGAKQVLRYAGKFVESQSISIRLPVTANVVTAVISVNLSLKSGAGTAGIADLFDGPIPAAREGVRVAAGAGQFAGQRVVPSEPTLTRGIVIGVVGLVPASQISVELQEDWQGLPSGKKIAAGAAVLPQAGRAQWAIISFPQPVAAPVLPYWILVSASAGAAVWLTATGSQPVSLLRQTSSGWFEVEKIQGNTALVHLLSAQFAPSGNGVSAAMPAAAKLNIGTHLISGVIAGGNVIFNIAPAMNAYLMEVRPGKNPTETVDIPLEFTTASAGLLTAYPPAVSFDA